MISALVLTLNEEVNLPHCLDSLDWCDDVVVLDSGSSDRTVEIARARGARVVQRPFDNWAAHQTWAAREIGYRHPWVYYSDADEQVTPALRDELLAVATDPARREVAYRVRFKVMFRGRWIRHSSLYPTWVMRFYRPEHVHWDRLVNPVAVADGPEGRLREHFLHHSFRKGMDAWYEKHRAYALDEAREAVSLLRADGGADLAGLVSRDTVRRRRALKELSFRLPCRPALRFLYMYVLRGGWLDGRPGLVYCRLLAEYEAMIDRHVRAWRRSGRLP